MSSGRFPTRDIVHQPCRRACLITSGGKFLGAAGFDFRYDNEPPSTNYHTAINSAKVNVPKSKETP